MAFLVFNLLFFNYIFNCIIVIWLYDLGKFKGNALESDFHLVISSHCFICWFSKLFCLTGFINSGAVDVKVCSDGKLSFKMLGLSLSSKLDRGSYIISIAKIFSKIIGALIQSMTFLFPEVVLYLYKSTIWLCMEYCCHI